MVGAVGQAKYDPVVCGNYVNALVDHAMGAVQKAGAADFGSLDAILSSKKELIRSKIEMLLIQLRQRKEINSRVVYSIDYDSCCVGNIQLEMCDNAYLMNKERIRLEQMKFDLEGQKRMEEVSYFRDTAMLNRELKDALLEYQKEVQNERIVMGESHDAQY